MGLSCNTKFQAGNSIVRYILEFPFHGILYQIYILIIVDQECQNDSRRHSVVRFLSWFCLWITAECDTRFNWAAVRC